MNKSIDFCNENFQMYYHIVYVEQLQSAARHVHLSQQQPIIYV